MILVACLLSVVGCNSVPLTSYTPTWMFPEKERTAYRTPMMRMDAISDFAARSNGTDSADQREMSDQLARQIQVEPDPLVREAIINAVAEFRTPMAHQVLVAGLQDGDSSVRIASCRKLGEREEPESVANLAAILEQDSEIDVRLAAAESLGKIKSPEAVQALGLALNDRDPALQYVGATSLHTITGRNYGGDIATWRQFVAGEDPQPAPAPSVADRMRRNLPF
jgi:hypothetical protein